jgi:hypothetical protein
MGGWGHAEVLRRDNTDSPKIPYAPGPTPTHGKFTLAQPTVRYFNSGGYSHFDTPAMKP